MYTLWKDSLVKKTKEKKKVAHFYSIALVTSTAHHELQLNTQVSGQGHSSSHTLIERAVRKSTTRKKPPSSRRQDSNIKKTGGVSKQQRGPPRFPQEKTTRSIKAVLGDPVVRGKPFLSSAGKAYSTRRLQEPLHQPAATAVLWPLHWAESSASASTSSQPQKPLTKCCRTLWPLCSPAKSNLLFHFSPATNTAPDF